MKRPTLVLLSVCAALFFAEHASAAPPSFTGRPIEAQLPADLSPLTLNLRELGVIAGSAPLSVRPTALIEDGRVIPSNFVRVAAIGGQLGAVCVQIQALDYQFNTQAGYELELSVASLEPRTVGPTRVPITGTPGPVANPQDLACADPNTQPTANAGSDRNIPDSDGSPGEQVALDGSGSADADPDTVLSYAWMNAAGQQIAAGAAPTISLPDGANVLTLVVTDDSFDPQTNTSTDTVTITVAAPAQNQPPTANAGADQSVPDSDGAPGELVTLSGSATDSDGVIESYEWFLGDTALGSGATLQVRLDDGVNVVRLEVADDDGNTASDDVQITIAEPATATAPVVDAGAAQVVADSDRNPGELVTLSGSATDPDGIASYEWFLGDTQLGAGQTLQVRLPNGVNLVTLVVTDNAGDVGAATVQVTVAAPSARGTLASLPNLNPNQRRTAMALDRICRDLDALDDDSANALTDDQRDLLSRCDDIYFRSDAAQQASAVGELVGDDFAAARTQTLLFANTQYMSIMERLMALRGGARGLSLAGLSIIVDGERIPLAELREMVQGLLGGGASADADSATSEADRVGGLLSDKWGMWARGNYSFGDKDASSLSPGFDADQWALVGGIDYRLSDNAVLGLSLSYGDSTIEFSPAAEGALDTSSWAASVYGSAYAARNFYLDAIVNFANSSFDARRNITYVNGGGLVDFDARGDTDGFTVSGGVSMGYDFLLGGLTVSPNLGAFYIDATIDEFTESGAGGLNLIYDEQTFESLTANLGLRLTYAWNLPWGVLLPHLRVDYVREFEDDVDVFGVRFASDPNATSTPPILVETDNPDRSYWRLATGFSAQFPHGVSGYVEYQRLESFQFISFQDVSIGLRMQRSF